MAWDPNLTNLRSVLADLYPEMPDAKRVVQEAGLRLEQIPFDSRAITNWHHILREAQKHNQVQAIVSVAQAEHPENEYLRQWDESSLHRTRSA